MPSTKDFDMEKDAANLLALLRKSSVPVDAKLKAFNDIKSDIKHSRVPEAAQAPIFECIKIAITQQASSNLVIIGFSTLQHLLRRLRYQNQNSTITRHGLKLTPVLLDRLGDPRESHRTAASQGFADLWQSNGEEVERTIRDVAIAGTNARAKETGMQWVSKMSQEHGLQFKSFVPYLVASLEEHDGGVREVAKRVIVDLFSNAPEHAKNDLRKQLKGNNVRKSIADQILSQIGIAPPPPPAAPEPDLSASAQSLPQFEHLNPAKGVADSVLNDFAQPPSQEDTTLEPLYVYSQRELEEQFRSMATHFEGKETEHNWMHRDKDVLKIRRLIKGNAPTEFHLAFVGNVKTLLEGILKVANSLRTTMSTNGCQLIQELSKSLGTSIDSMVEILLQNFIKMTANTKHIAADNGNATTEALFSHVTYNKRLMEHVWFACQDKNVQTRTYAPGWLKIMLKRQEHNKGYFESSGGLDLAEKCINKGLGDANPKVRESMRAAYWSFAKGWPDKAEVIMSNLDAKSQALLEKDSNNPNAPSLSSSVSSVTGSKPSLKSSMTASRSNLKEMMAKQKQQMAAKRVPDRPNSAMSTFSPAKQTTTTHARVPSTTSSRGGPRPPSAAASSRREAAGQSASNAPAPGSLMSGPVRRPRRPEINRPKTADPYARRNGGIRPETPSNPSPVESPKKSVRKPTVTSPNAKRTIPSGSPKASPRTSPAKSRSKMDVMVDSSSPAENDDFTMVVPAGTSLASRTRPGPSKTMSASEGADEDGFTMVIPQIPPMQAQSAATSPERVRRSPQRSRTDVSASGSPKPPNTPKLQGTQGTPRLQGQISSETPGSEKLSRPVTGNDTPSRRGSPIRQMEEVQVFEDESSVRPSPAAAISAHSPQKTPLEELPINDQGYGRSPSPGSGSSAGSPNTNGAPNGMSPTRLTNGTQTPQDRAETLRARRLLASGIERIKARTLDAHGFRRLQELVKSPNTDIWTSTPLPAPDSPNTIPSAPLSSPTKSTNKLADLLLALTSYIETPLTTLSPNQPTKATNLKGQALATTTALLCTYPATPSTRKTALSMCPRALAAILHARREVEDVSHLAAEFERSAAHIVAVCQPLDALVDILDVVDAQETESAHTDTNSEDDLDGPQVLEAKIGKVARARILAMGLDVLSQLLRRLQVADGGWELSVQQRQRLGAMAVKFLEDEEPDVRRADTGFCVELYDVITKRGNAVTDEGEEGKAGEDGKGEFWKVVGSAGEGSLNLITYYLAKRGKA
ncbi:MAG: suppressor of tub2 mutation [Bogoriella megaspora]|nr:MAG: suppressor of tub2 mutation [Bogoriella megaspora]